MEWAAPIVFVSKKDEKPRFCVDYCCLNSVTVRESYLFTRMNQSIESLGDAGVFYSPDPDWRHWKIEIDERNRDKLELI